MKFLLIKFSDESDNWDAEIGESDDGREHSSNIWYVPIGPHIGPFYTPVGLLARLGVAIEEQIADSEDGDPMHTNGVEARNLIANLDANTEIIVLIDDGAFKKDLLQKITGFKPEAVAHADNS